MTSGPTVVLRVPIFYMRVVGRAGIPGWTAPEKHAARSGRGAGRVHPVGARLTVSTTAATPSAACPGLALTTSEITTSEITTCGIDFVDPAGTPSLRRDPPHAASCVSDRRGQHSQSQALRVGHRADRDDVRIDRGGLGRDLSERDVPLTRQGEPGRHGRLVQFHPDEPPLWYRQLRWCRQLLRYRRPCAAPATAVVPTTSAASTAKAGP